MTVYLMPEPLLYPIVARMAESELRQTAKDIERNAEANLNQAQATTEWEKLAPPLVKRQQASNLTKIGMDILPAGSGKNKYGNDYIVWMTGGEDNRAAMAIEMGHSPSGYYKFTDTASPRGLHILGRAAGLTMLMRFRR